MLGDSQLLADAIFGPNFEMVSTLSFFKYILSITDKGTFYFLHITNYVINTDNIFIGGVMVSVLDCDHCSKLELQSQYCVHEGKLWIAP